MRTGRRCLTAAPAIRAARQIDFTTWRHLAHFSGGAGSSRRWSTTRAQSVLAGLSARTPQGVLIPLLVPASDGTDGCSPLLGRGQLAGRDTVKHHLGRPESLLTYDASDGQGGTAGDTPDEAG